MKPTVRVSLNRTDISLATTILVAWLCILATAASIWIKPWPDILFRADFVAFWSAGSMVREGNGESLFDIAAQRAFQQELRQRTGTTTEALQAVDHSPFYNLPALALPFVPLSMLPLPIAYLLWNVASAVMMVASFALPLRGRNWAASTTAALFSTGFVASTLFEGQVNGIFALAISLAILALRGNRIFMGGVLFGVLWLKPQYAIMVLLVLTAKKRWRELAGMSASGVVIGGISLAMVGLNGVIDFLDLMRRVGSYYALDGYRVSPHAMVNWRAATMNLVPGLSEEAGYMLMTALAAITMALALLAWRGRWAPSSPYFGIQMTVTIAATLVANPHSHFHGVVLLLPPLAVALLSGGTWAKRRRVRLYLIAVGYTLSLFAFPLREISWLFVPYLLVGAAFLIKEVTSVPRGGALAEAIS